MQLHCLLYPTSLFALKSPSALQRSIFYFSTRPICGGNFCLAMMESSICVANSSRSAHTFSSSFISTGRFLRSSKARFLRRATKRLKTPMAALIVEPNKSDQFEQQQQQHNGIAKNKLQGKSSPLSSSSTTTTSLQTSKKTSIRTASVQDYMEQAIDLIRDDSGPPRWFCPLDCGQPIINKAPLLLFLPGMDGTGLGLLLHHQTLAPLFEVRCLHIPVQDRTPFEGLVRLVEETVREEHKLQPSRPIYLIGDSFGGTLALAIAARNPSIDLSLVLANPATSIDKSQLQPLFPLLYAIPDEAFTYLPYLLSFTMGDPIRMASAKAKNTQDPLRRSQKIINALNDLLPTLPTLAAIMPKGTLLWKLKLLREGALYANSRLHAVRAQVLILASEKDQLLPSAAEAKRLKSCLRECKVRYFKDSGHTLLLEDGQSLATIIKSTLFYRTSKQRDFVTDYVFPTKEEFNTAYETTRMIRRLISPVFLSTDENGEVIEGLSGIPKDKPLLLVGNHMLMGIELSLIVGEIFKQRNLLVRGLAHPTLFRTDFQSRFDDQSYMDQIGLFGGTPVSGKNFYKLLANQQSVLLYPGGAREALHRKGEAYKLFWPEQSEFVRMAANFGATIIPFSGVGEDDIFELLLDYNDLSQNVILKNLILTSRSDLRPESAGEVANQPLYLPLVAPRVPPGRFYFKFGKPIPTEGRREELRNKKRADELYKHVKKQVESGIEYLLEKRQEDPYRNSIPRLIYEASWAAQDRQGPSFMNSD